MPAALPPVSARRAIALLLLLSAHGALADKQDITPAPHNLDASNRDRVAEQFQLDQTAFAGQAHVLVRPGLLANRETRQVRIYAEAVGLDPKAEVEFVLIAPGSSHNYESLAVSFARGADIRRAMEFIGVPPGQPISPQDHRFWPVGERVRITVESPAFPEANAQVRQIPAPSLLLDRRTGAPPAFTSWMFTGSYILPEEAGEDAGRLAVDAFDPGSFISVFNDAQTLFDVPLQWAKGAVYGHLFAHPGQPLPKNQLIAFVLEPIAPAGQSSALHLELQVSPATDEDSGPALRLADHPDETTPAFAPAELEGRIREVLAQGKDLHLGLAPSPSLPLEQLKPITQMLDRMEREMQVRVGPPKPGEVYYRAFNPNPAFANREERPSQPWELHVVREGGTLRVQPVLIEQDWGVDATTPTLRVRSFPVMDPADLPELLRSHDNMVPVLLFFCPGDVTYGELLGLAAPLRENFPVVYVFGSDKP